MGIRSLDSYITQQTPNVRKPTNILKVAEKTFRSKVLIVDLNCVLRSSYTDLSLVNDGDFPEFKDRWRVFLYKLEMAKIRPIFVIVGPTCVYKRDTWTSRRQYESYDQFVQPMFERLRNQEEEEEFAWKDSESQATSIPRLEIGEMIMFALGQVGS